MKNRLQRRTESPAVSLKGLLRLPLVGVVLATTLIAVGAVAAVSRQQAQAKNDAQTDQSRAVTPEEARKLADGIKERLNRSSDDLPANYHPDGSVSVDLQGRFQNVAVAKRNADGSVTQSCIDNPQSAAEFFGIDPQVFEGKIKAAPASSGKSAQANRRTTEKGQE
jgi:hypothetical protein